MKRLMAVLLCVGVVLAVAGVWYAYDTGRFWVAQTDLSWEAERAYHRLGREAASRVLCLARPYLCSSPLPNLMDDSEKFGELEYRVGQIPNFSPNSIDGWDRYESPRTLLGIVFSEYVSWLALHSDPYRSHEESFDIAKKDPAFRYSWNLHDKVLAIDSLRYKISKARSWRELQELEDEFLSERKALENALHNEAPGSAIPVRKPVKVGV